MISDNILKWYTDEIIRSKYNVLGWSLIEKQIKEDKAEQHRIIHEYNISNLRSELGRTLPKHIVAKLEQLRK